MIHLNYRDARPIYTQICDGIREQIVSGVLHQGERIASVRELATELTINPNTIQRAYRELEMQGWIVTVPGKGCFVSGIPQGDREQTKPLLDQFDRLTAQLLALGVSPQELKDRIS